MRCSSMRYESVKEAAVFAAFAGPSGLLFHPAVFKGFGNGSPSWGAALMVIWHPS